jgi:hypothetical protein
MKKLYALVFVLLAGNLLAARTVWTPVKANSSLGTCTAVSDEAAVGSITLTVDAVSTTSLTTSGSTTMAYANKTGNHTNTTSDCVVSYNTAAVTTNTLPEASTVYGQLLVICLQDDDGDLVVVTDGTDTFDGTNTKVTMADAGDSLQVMATASNVYTILCNVGGTLGTL